MNTSLFDALRADTHPSRAAVLHNPDTLQVGEPFFLCPVVRVAHTIPYLFPLPAYVTNSCHKNPDPCYIVLPSNVESKVYSLVSSVSIEISTPASMLRCCGPSMLRDPSWFAGYPRAPHLAQEGTTWDGGGTCIKNRLAPAEHSGVQRMRPPERPIAAQLSKSGAGISRNRLKQAGLWHLFGASHNDCPLSCQSDKETRQPGVTRRDDNQK